MVAALALAGGACGGDDDDVTDDASTESEGSIADADSDDDSADSGNDDSGNDDSGNDDSGNDGSGDEWCSRMDSAEFDTEELDNLDINDPESVENAFGELVELMDEAADSAPDAIEDDVQLVVDQARTFFETLEDADFNFLDVDQSTFENPEAEAASDRISEYCGFDDDDTDSSDDSDSTDDTSDAVLSGEGTVRDELLRQFTAMGMTDDQANCLVDNLDMDEVAESGASDPSMFLDLFEACDINMAELTPGG